MATPARHIGMTFTETLARPRGRSVPCVVVPDSGEVLGTRRAVQVEGTVDGHAVRLSLVPAGDGTHMALLRGPLTELLGKGVGQDVTVHLSRIA